MLIVTLGEAIVLIIFVMFLISWIGATTMVAIKQWLCMHDEGINETQACDAICKKCGKNLGFIGTPENTKRRHQ